MKFKNLAEQMAERGYSLTLWARSRGLNMSDIRILRELSRGGMKGAFGRGAEIRKMLEQENFKFNCEAKIKPHHKRKFID